jgi:chitodextrinase
MTLRPVIPAFLLLTAGFLWTAEPRPDPPRDVTAEALDATRVRITWREGRRGTEPESYLVLRDDAVVARVESEEWTDEGLQPWTEYRYGVVAVDEKERQSDPSETVTVRTPDGTPPGAPGAPVIVAATENSLQISWPAADDPESGIAAYQVFRDGAAAGVSPAPSLLDEPLAASTAYAYRVQAVNGAGEVGPIGPEATLRTPDPPHAGPDTIPPAPPSGLRSFEPS